MGLQRFVAPGDDEPAPGDPGAKPGGRHGTYAQRTFVAATGAPAKPVDAVRSARLVHIDTNWFYQVGVGKSRELRYFSTRNGQRLPQGDWLYAQYLARQFLEGPAKPTLAAKPMPAMPGMDCCGEAATAVLHPKAGAAVRNASLIEHFDAEYKPVYNLLPVHKVQFERPDQIRLYVDTGQDRLAIAVDRNRAWFTIFFDLMHTWGWLDFLGQGRLLVEICLAGLGFLTALTGLYILFTTRAKRAKSNPVLKSRRRHRFNSVIAVLFTLMFTLSGAYHAFSKLGKPEKVIRRAEESFRPDELAMDLKGLRRVAKAPFLNIGLVRIDKKVYWQAYTAPDSAMYIGALSGKVLANGDAVYAQSLAHGFSGLPATAVVSTERVTHFTDEYNFADKRLPVWKVSYRSKPAARTYVETSTATLAKEANGGALWEGYSFALLHKHHFMDWAGKTSRDVNTMLGAALQVLLVVVGMLLFFRSRRKSGLRKD